MSSHVARIGFWIHDCETLCNNTERRPLLQSCVANIIIHMLQSHKPETWHNGCIEH